MVPITMFWMWLVNHKKIGWSEGEDGDGGDGGQVGGANVESCSLLALLSLVWVFISSNSPLYSVVLVTL